MKKILLAISALAMILSLSGCGKQPSNSKIKYELDKSKTVAPTKDGKLHGKVKKYARNGQPWSVETYVNGIKDGPAVQYKSLSYYQNGKAWIKEESMYVNGKKEGILTLYDTALTHNGRMRFKVSDIPMKNGLQHGVAEIYDFSLLWHDKVYLRESKPMKNGVLHGTWKGWNFGSETGRRLQYSIEYKDGQKHGYAINYGYANNLGKYGITRKTKYKNGVEIGPKIDNVYGKITYLDKASVNSRIAANKKKEALMTQKACRYIKNYFKIGIGAKTTAEQNAFTEAKIACEHGWITGGASSFAYGVY